MNEYFLQFMIGGVALLALVLAIDAYGDYRLRRAQKDD
jgi:hypothetical protein